MKRIGPCIRAGVVGSALFVVSMCGPAFGQEVGKAQQSTNIRESDERDFTGASRIFLDRNLQMRRGVLRGITADSVLMVEELAGGMKDVGADGVRLASRVERISRSELLAITSPVVKTGVVQAGAALALWSNPSVRRDQTAPGRLELVDGQSLPGNFWVEGSKDEMIGWSSHTFGRVSIPLETVRMMVLRPLAFAQHSDARAMQETLLRGVWKQDQDAVFLMNGDRADGFLASFGQQAVIEQDGKEISLPEDRISAVALANPAAGKQGIWVWLYNGSVLCVDEVMLDSREGLGDRGEGGNGGNAGSGGSWGSGYVVWHMPLNKRAIAFGGQGVDGQTEENAPNGEASKDKPVRATIAVGDIRAICFDFAQVTPLATVPISQIKPLDGRRWAPPAVVGDVRLAPLNAADIELAGPLEVEWPLPTGSTRLGGQIELAPSSKMWGDCEVSIELVIDGEGQGVAKPLWKKRLWAQESEHAFNIVLTPQTGTTRLRMRIEAREGGPVQDRVIVRRGLVVK